MHSPVLAVAVGISLLTGPVVKLCATPVEVVTAELRGAVQPQVAMSPNGRIHVVFGKGGSIYHTTSTDGARSFSKPVHIADLPQLALGMRRGPRVTATDKLITVTAISHSDGDLHAWTSGSRDMYLAASADGGKTFAPAEKLGTGTWKLSGCPMDGGALTFAAPSKLITVWRREKAVFATQGAASEQRLADSALQALAVGGKFGIAYIWEQGGGLMVKKGSSPPARLAEGGTFAAAASAPGGDPVVVWESAATSEKTITADVLR